MARRERAFFVFSTPTIAGASGLSQLRALVGAALQTSQVGDGTKCGSSFQILTAGSRSFPSGTVLLAAGRRVSQVGTVQAQFPTSQGGTTCMQADFPKLGHFSAAALPTVGRCHVRLEDFPSWDGGSRSSLSFPSWDGPAREADVSKDGATCRPTFPSWDASGSRGPSHGRTVPRAARRPSQVGTVVAATHRVSQVGTVRRAKPTFPRTAPHAGRPSQVGTLQGVADLPTVGRCHVRLEDLPRRGQW